MKGLMLEHVPYGVPIVLALLFLYYFVLYPVVTHTKGYKGNHNNNSTHFLKKRTANYPPPYPNGWWKLCNLSELDNGNVLSINALGLDLVVFRGRKNGKVGVLDAHCPHLGAHLGKGKVTGDCLQCPFHGWEINAEGKCEKIPYSDAAIPKNARSRHHHHMIYADMVLLWFHAEGAEPTYDMLDLSHLKDWQRFAVRNYVYDMHITDMQENSADYFHFNFLHKPMPLKKFSWFMDMRYETELFFNEDKDRQHQCYFISKTFTHIFGWEVPFYYQTTKVTLDGPGFLHFDIRTPLGRMWMIKSVLPREPFKQYVEDVIYIDPWMPRWVASILVDIAAGALEQDRPMWENRVFCKNPVLVKGDGPFMKYRSWFFQFYSESSAHWAEQKCLEWSNDTS